MERRHVFWEEKKTQAQILDLQSIPGRLLLLFSPPVPQPMGDGTRSQLSLPNCPTHIALIFSSKIHFPLRYMYMDPSPSVHILCNVVWQNLGTTREQDVILIVTFVVLVKLGSGGSLQSTPLTAALWASWDLLQFWATFSGNRKQERPHRNGNGGHSAWWLGSF